MIPVIIADDEPKIRRNLIDLIEWEPMGLTLTGEVSDGDSLLAALQSITAEIALIDMKMPGLSGGRLIRRLAEEYPSMKLVIISGYDDFEYTKAAISANVMGYILKPVDQKELNEVLAKSIQALEEASQRKQQSVLQKTALKKYDTLLLNTRFWNLMENGSVSGKELLRCLDKKTSEGFHGRLAIFKLENILVQEAPEENGGMHWIMYSLQNILEELFCGIGKVFCHSDNQTASLFLYHELPSSELEEKLRAGTLYIRQYCQMTVFIGVSTATSKPGDFHRLYTEALDSVMNHNVLQNTPVTWYDTLRGKLPESILKNYLPMINECASCTFPLAFQAVIRAYHELKEEHYLSLRDLLIFNQAALNLLLNAGKAKENPAIMRQLYTLQQTLLQELNPAKISALLASFLHCHKELLLCDNESRLAHQLKKSIDQNLHQNISVDELARTFNFSKPYLYRVFKQEFHISPHQYLLERKVEKAKILLMNPEIKAFEIVALLGFSDESHFSKVFKRMTGLSPKQWGCEKMELL